MFDFDFDLTPSIKSYRQKTLQSGQKMDNLHVKRPHPFFFSRLGLFIKNRIRTFVREDKINEF